MIRAGILGLVTLIVATFGVATVMHGGAVATALYTLTVNFTNPGTTDLDDIQAAFDLSGAGLIDGNFMASDALNARIHKSDTDIPGMPPNNRIQIEGAVQEHEGAFTEYTTAAQNTTANDVQILTATPAVNDAFYFGCDNPCRIATWEIDTPGVGTWALVYEYWDGDSYETLANVDDRTNAFTAGAQHTVSWDMPTDWATSTVTGSAVNSYWARARVSTFTSITTQPLGTRLRYENGQWWTWIEDLDVNGQEIYTLHLGGATDLVTAHQVFPGLLGVVTSDNANIELGNAYSVGIVGRVSFKTPSTGACLLCKVGAVTLAASGSASAPVVGTSLIGGGTSGGDTSLTLPATGEQTVIMAADGVNAATFVGAGGMVSYDVQTITDNANSLTWASNAGMDYFDSIRVDTVAPTIFTFEDTFTEFDTGTHTRTQAYTGLFGLDNL